MVRVRLKSLDRMSNCEWHMYGNPYWWARIGDEFLPVSRTRGDNWLDVYLDIDKEPPFVIHYGVGPKAGGQRGQLKVESEALHYELYDYEDSLDFLKRRYPASAYSQFAGMTYDEILAKIESKLIKDQGYIDLDKRAIEHQAQAIFDELKSSVTVNQ